MNTKKLYKIEDIVFPILEGSVSARNDDYYLYNEVIHCLCPEVEHLEFSFVMKNHKQLGVPSYESITRVRRKIQEKCPHLRSDKMTERRKKEESVYREYART